MLGGEQGEDVVAAAGVLVQSGVLYGRCGLSVKGENGVALSTSSLSISMPILIWVARMNASSSSVTLRHWA